MKYITIPNIIKTILLIVPAVLMFLIERGSLSLGLFLHNTILPCVQAPENSLPCHAEYDLYAIAVLGVWFVVVLAFVLFGFLKTEPYVVKK
jgi:hypothetical protein